MSGFEINGEQGRFDEKFQGSFSRLMDTKMDQGLGR